MGKVKEKLQEISELIQTQLNSGIDFEDLDSYMELELNLSDYAFYLENKDTILKFFESLKTKGTMLSETENFTRGLDPKTAMNIGDKDARKKEIIKKIIEFDPTLSFDEYQGNLPKFMFVTRKNPVEWDVPILKTITYYELLNLYNHLKSKLNESFYPKLLERYDEYGEDDEDYDEEQEAEVPEADKEAAHLYYNDEGMYQKEYELYWNKLVPSQGNADTVQGELLRCLTNIIYDRYNNGFGNDKKKEAQQLSKYKNRFEKYLKKSSDFNWFYHYYYDINFGKDRYLKNNWIGDKYFDPIMDAILKYIMNSEEFEQFPEEDKYYNK